jgi:hypothetical protein
MRQKVTKLGVAAVLAGVLLAAPPTVIRAGKAEPHAAVAIDAALPERLTDSEFWALRRELSEPGGYFRITDNYTSNEGEIGRIFTALQRDGIKGGVYLGVGPEQNLTYIAAIRPGMAFIVDIRSQAAMQHLMFKALFEMARDRAEFISLLFARPRPPDLDATTGIQDMWHAFSLVGTDAAMAARTYGRVVERLTMIHGFELTPEEASGLVAVIQAFVGYGPTISTRGGGGFGGNNYSFADLTGWSIDDGGEPRSFLSTEENFGYLKSLHERNLVVPITGDFGGPKALRAIGAYVKQQGAVVRAFYVSNVEQYLFQDGKATTFYANVAELPVDAASVFIRPYSLRRSPLPRPLCPIAPFLAAVSAGQVASNFDSLACGGR